MNTKYKAYRHKGIQDTILWEPFCICIRTLLWRAGRLVILIILIVLTGCENDIHKVQALGNKSTGVEEGKDIVSYLSQSGKVKAKLTAPIMLRTLLDTVKVEFPKGLHVLFYDSLTNVESDLVAKYGNYYENDNKVFLRDSVRVFNVKGDTLWCKELYWDQNKGTFYTDKPIKIKQSNPRQLLFGLGMTADQNFKWFSINHTGLNYTGFDNYMSVPYSTY